MHNKSLSIAIFSLLAHFCMPHAYAMQQKESQAIAFAELIVASVGRHNVLLNIKIPDTFKFATLHDTDFSKKIMYILQPDKNINDYSQKFSICTYKKKKTAQEAVEDVLKILTIKSTNISIIEKNYQNDELGTVVKYTVVASNQEHKTIHHGMYFSSPEHKCIGYEHAVSLGKSLSVTEGINIINKFVTKHISLVFLCSCKNGKYS